MPMDIAGLTKDFQKLINIAYQNGVSDGYERGALRPVPKTMLTRWQHLRAEYIESGDAETAGLIDAMIKDLHSNMRVEIESKNERS